MEKLILKWVEKRLISEEKAQELLGDYKLEMEKTRKTRSQIALYTIGAVLIGLGVISFIAANNWILELFTSGFLKIFVLSALTIYAFYSGYKLAYENKNYPRLGKTLIFLSTLLIGGTYALIGQVYNLNANNSFLMLLWMWSVLPLAYIFKDKAINVLSIILFALGVIFYYMELSFDTGQTWTIFIPIIFGTFLYSLGNLPILQNKYNTFSLSYKLTGLVPLFTTFLILTCSVENSYKLISVNYILPVIFVFAFNFINIFLEKDKNLLFKLEQGFIFTTLILLLSLLTLPVISIITTKIVANTLIIFIIATGFSFGYRFENIKLINLSTSFLIIYITTTYFRLGWNYFDKTLFFIFGGMCLLGLGFLLERKKKELIKGDK